MGGDAPFGDAIAVGVRYRRGTHRARGFRPVSCYVVGSERAYEDTGEGEGGCIIQKRIDEAQVYQRDGTNTGDLVS